MLVFGTMYWRTGAGTPTPPPPAPQPDTFGGFGYRPSGGFPLDERARSREEISRARERFGLKDDVAQALAEVAARQAAAEVQAAGEQAAADEQKRFDELYRELQLRRVEFDARYLEALTAMREVFIAQIRQQREEEELMLLMLVAAAAAV